MNRKQRRHRKERYVKILDDGKWVRKKFEDVREGDIFRIFEANGVEIHLTPLKATSSAHRLTSGPAKGQMMINHEPWRPEK